MLATIIIVLIVVSIIRMMWTTFPLLGSLAGEAAVYEHPVDVSVDEPHQYCIMSPYIEIIDGQQRAESGRDSSGYEIPVINQPVHVMNDVDLYSL